MADETRVEVELKRYFLLAKLLVSEERRRYRVGQWQNRCLAITEAPVFNYWLDKARKLGVEQVRRQARRTCSWLPPKRSV
jgi:hypothetical protein